MRSWLIVGTLAVGLYSWVEFWNQQYGWPIVGLWLASVVTFLILVCEAPSWSNTWPRSEWVLATLVLGIGIFLRLYHLDDIPFGLNQDAAYAGNVALRAARSSSYLPWSPDPAAGETFFDYMVVGLLKLGITGSLALKGVCAIAGILGLVGMYLFTRRLLDSTVAVIATFLMATSGWHLIFSRAGWRCITTPTVELFALYFLFGGFRDRRRGNFALGGALLALVLNTYPSGRIIPVIVGIWAIVELVRGPDRMGLVRGYFLALVSFLLAGASILAFAETNPSLFNARYNSVSVLSSMLAGDWGYVFQHIGRTVGIFTVRANGNDFFLDQPLLDLPVRWLFVLGTPITVWWIPRRHAGYAFVLLALYLGLLPAFVSEWPNGNRATDTMPFVFIIAALPLRALLDLTGLLRSADSDDGSTRRIPWIQRIVRRLRDTVPLTVVEAALRAVVALVLAVTLYGTFNQYLGPNRSFIWGFYGAGSEVANYVRHIDDRYDVYLLNNGAFGINTTTYLTARPSDPLLPFAGGNPTNPVIWPHFHDDGTLNVPRVRVGPRKGVAIIIVSGADDRVREALRRYPRAKSFTLMYKDGQVSSTAASVVLVPPTGGNVDADIALGLHLWQHE